MIESLSRLRIGLVILCLILFAGAIGLYRVFSGPNDFVGGGERTVFVSRGQTFSSIVDTLETRGIIRSRASFVFVAKMFGGSSRMQIGKYTFPSGISNSEIFLMLREGRGSLLVSVTLREGLRSLTQARILARAIGIDSARYVALVHDEGFARSLGIDRPSLEGYLLPETYAFSWQPDEREVIRRQVTQFKRIYNDSLQTRARSLGWTMNKVVTMASIVEGEAVLAEERPIISGVYHNRLRKGMRLEADPTIQFILGDGPRRVLYADLKRDDPYNTYLYAGLPPGPINNPGKSAILAALFPVPHNYLYFVANGEGGHWFSSNYYDHLRRVKMFRKNRSEQQAQMVSPSGGTKVQ